MAEHEEKLKNEPVCSECEKQELLSRIAYLEERSSSPILGSRQNKASFIQRAANYVKSMWLTNSITFSSQRGKFNDEGKEKTIGAATKN